MTFQVTPAFGRGQTHYKGQTIDTADYGGSVALEGLEGIFDDRGLRTSTEPQTVRSGLKTKGIICRNVSGIALLPSRAVSFSAGFQNRRTAGYTTTDWAAVAGVVDDQLPAAGVPNGDLFWLLVEGPALMLTDLAGGALNVINEGDHIVALTAATSQATTAGRVQSYVATSNATNIATMVLNRVGTAMSAKTTANSNATVLVNLRLR